MNINNPQERENLFKNQLEENTKKIMESFEREECVFTFNKDKAALIIIDMQNYFFNASHFLNIETVIDNINNISSLCRQANIPVIWVKHNFTKINNKDDSGLYPYFHKKPLSEKIYNKHPETEIYHKLNYDSLKDYNVFKNRYSAFIEGSSNINTLLKEINRSQLIVTGIASNVCVESSIRDAMQLDYEVFMISDATTTVDKTLHLSTLMNVKLFFGDVYSTSDLIRAIQD